MLFHPQSNTPPPTTNKNGEHIYKNKTEIAKFPQMSYSRFVFIELLISAYFCGNKKKMLEIK